jgi:hypothetical protein
MTLREEIIRNYVEAYNRFDTDGMIRDFADSIRFENISNGESNLLLEGLAAFRSQAEQMKNIFSEREQTIKSFEHRRDETKIEIEYHAVLAADLPNGLKAGGRLNLSGRSVFKFEGNKIIEVTDIS